MGLFASVRSRSTAAPEAKVELFTAQLPARWTAVGEALASGADPVPACGVVGHELARDGASLVESLTALHDTYQTVLGVTPPFDALLTLSQAWSESTLGYLHQLSCEDPLTGLASLAHLRARLSEVYRAQDITGIPVREAYVLVVVDLVRAPGAHDGARFGGALRLAKVGEAARTVFPGAETVGSPSRHRVAVLAARDQRLAQRSGLLRRMLDGQPLDGHRARVWIEGLPSTEASAAAVLDELARD
jgi:hypothetical protein